MSKNASRPVLLMLSLTLSFCLMHSCATKERREEVLVVDLENGDRGEAIKITDEAHIGYGPAPEGAVESNENETTRASIVALDLFPALYNSLGYVSTFSELEKANVRAHIISSSGFSSIIAALYAKHGVSNMVEWKTFELYQLLGSQMPFSERWKKTISEFLDEEFGDEKLNQLGRLLVIPKYINGKVVFNGNQKVSTAIMESIDLSGGASMLTSGAFGYLSGLRSYGADHVMRISFLPKRITLKHPDGFVFGVYSRLVGKALQQGDSEVFVFDDALKGDLDAFQNLSDMIHQTEDENAFFAREAKALLEESSGKN